MKTKIAATYVQGHSGYFVCRLYCGDWKPLWKNEVGINEQQYIKNYTDYDVANVAAQIVSCQGNLDYVNMR